MFQGLLQIVKKTKTKVKITNEEQLNYLMNLVIFRSFVRNEFPLTAENKSFEEALNNKIEQEYEKAKKNIMK